MARNRPTDAGAPTDPSTVRRARRGGDGGTDADRDDPDRGDDITDPTPDSGGPTLGELYGFGNDTETDTSSRKRQPRQSEQSNRQQRRTAAEARANQFESDPGDAVGSVTPDRDTTTPSRPEAAQRQIANRQETDPIDRFDAGADVLAGSTDEAVGRAVDAATDLDAGGVGDALAGSTDEAAARALEDLQAGDVAAAADDAAGGVDDVARDVIDAGAALGGAVAEDVTTVDRDDLEDVADDVARESAANLEDGGLPGATATAVLGGTASDAVRDAAADADVIDELQDGGGFLSPEDEQDLQTAGERLDQDIERAADDLAATSPMGQARIARDALGFGTPGEDVDTEVFGITVDPVRDGEGPGERAIEEGLSDLGGLANPFSAAAGAENVAEALGNTPDAVESEGTGAAAETGTAVVRETTDATLDAAASDPAGTFGTIAAGFGASRAAGAALGRVDTGLAVARRRAGGNEEFDPTETTNPETVGFFEGDNTNADAEFPGFRPEEGESFVDAFERQAEEFTPDAVDEQFPEDAPGVTTVNTAEADSSPPADGFDVAREGRGQPDDPVGGLFVSPELSPFNVLDASDRGGSFSPGIPFVNRRRGQATMTRQPIDRLPDDVGNEGTTRRGPDDAGDETRALRERAGEPRAFVRSPENLNPGEAEAIVPPETEFVPVGQSTPFTRFGGGLFDVETFAPRRILEDDDGDLDADTADALGLNADADTADGSLLDDLSVTRAELSERNRAATDRDLFGPSGLPGSASRSGSTSDGGSSSGPLFGDSDPFGGSSRGESGSSPFFPGGSSGLSPASGGSGSSAGGSGPFGGSRGGSSGGSRGSTTPPVSSGGSSGSSGSGGSGSGPLLGSPSFFSGGSGSSGGAGSGSSGLFGSGSSGGSSGSGAGGSGDSAPFVAGFGPGPSSSNSDTDRDSRRDDDEEDAFGLLGSVDALFSSGIQAADDVLGFSDGERR